MSSKTSIKCVDNKRYRLWQKQTDHDKKMDHDNRKGWLWQNQMQIMTTQNADYENTKWIVW